jgi:dCMP deaminase
MNKYDIPMMKTAEVWAEMSKCKRAKVGAVIAKENNIISVGYNGTPTGYKTKSNYECEEEIEKEIIKEIETICCPFCEEEVDLIEDYDEQTYFCENCKKKLTEAEIILKKKNEKIKIKELKTDHDLVIHAEQNAILYAARLGHSNRGATLYVTLSPCKKCATLIKQAGITRVVYKEKYRDDSGIKMLKELKIKVEQLKLN